MIAAVNVTARNNAGQMLLVACGVAAIHVAVALIPEQPEGPTGKKHATTFAVSLTRDGRFWLDGLPSSEDDFRSAIRAGRTNGGVRLVIASDPETERDVDRIIDLFRRSRDER